MGETRRGWIGRGSLVIVSSALMVGWLFTSSVSAQDQGVGSGADDQIVVTGTLVVPQDGSVATAMIFNGDAIIEGTVTENVVVFNGDVDVSGTVGQDVVAFNGHVTVRSGARIDGDVISRRLTVVEDGATIGGEAKGFSGRFNFAKVAFFGRMAWWIGYSISTLLLGLALLLLAPGIDGALAEAFKRRTGASFGFGAAIFFLLPIAAVVALVIVVAIPLGLYLLLGLALLYSIGYVVGAHILGRQLFKPRSRFAAFLAGWGILRAVALIPFFGGVAWILASIVGLGASMIAARQAPAVMVSAVPAPPAPPAPSAPPSAPSSP